MIVPAAGTACMLLPLPSIVMITTSCAKLLPPRYRSIHSLVTNLLHFWHLIGSCNFSRKWPPHCLQENRNPERNQVGKGVVHCCTRPSPHAHCLRKPKQRAWLPVAQQGCARKSVQEIRALRNAFPEPRSLPSCIQPSWERGASKVLQDGRRRVRVADWPELRQLQPVCKHQQLREQRLVKRGRKGLVYLQRGVRRTQRRLHGRLLPPEQANDRARHATK